MKKLKCWEALVEDKQRWLCMKDLCWITLAFVQNIFNFTLPSAVGVVRQRTNGKNNTFIRMQV